MKHLLIASLVSVLTVFLVTFVVTFIDSIGSAYSHPLITLFIAGVSAMVASIVVLVWAIPIHLVLKRLNRPNVAWYLLSATVPAFVFIYIFKPLGNDSDVHLFGQAIICTIYGCLGVLSFWYIAVYRQRITKVLKTDVPEELRPTA
jgi:hypothetical protein